MIYLDANSVEILKARRFHKEKLVNLLNARMANVTNPSSTQFFNNNIRNNLNHLLIGKPDQLITLSNRINLLIGNNNNLKEDIKYVFKYEWFIYKASNRYSGYELASNLDVNTCAYCNRNYTSTVITQKNKKLIRPQFDHYFDKKTHPILALSFYNLIPSCSICNTSIKHSKIFTLQTHPHPFVDNILGEFKFSFKFINDPYYKNGLKIFLDVYRDWYTRNYLKDLEIQEVYSAHTDVLYDLLRTKQAYSDRYLNILESNVLNGIKISRSEIYRLVFGVHLNEKDFKKRPLSKLKKDILTELSII